MGNPPINDNTQVQEQLYLGIDGGGTKCRARIISASGRMLGTGVGGPAKDRKSTRLNSSHVRISYAVFCLKKKKIERSSLPSHTKNTISRESNLQSNGSKAVKGSM